MLISNLDVITEEFINSFDPTDDVSNYLSEKELLDIVLFKGFIVVVNTWDTLIDLKTFNIDSKSSIKVFNKHKKFLYQRNCFNHIFGDDEEDENVILNSQHADYLILQFDTVFNNYVNSNSLLVWMNHKLDKDAVLALSNNAIREVNDLRNDVYTNEVFLDLSSINKLQVNQIGVVYYKYLPGSLNKQLTFQDIYTNPDSQIGLFSLNKETFYPLNGWFIFYQEVQNTITLLTEIRTLDLANTVGVGFNRFIFNKSGSMYIDLSNRDITFNTLLNDLNTEQSRFIRLEAVLVYKQASVCFNRNISTARGLINFIDNSDNCGNLLETQIFSDVSQTQLPFGLSEIFISEDSFLFDCTDYISVNPFFNGLSNNRNFSFGHLDATITTGGNSYNRNNTYCLGVGIRYAAATTVNRNNGVLNTLINIAATANINVSTALSSVGKLGGFGITHNQNVSNALSTIVFSQASLNANVGRSINRNTSRAALDTFKGFANSTFHYNLSSAKGSKNVFGSSNTVNLNVANIVAFNQISSSNGFIVNTQVVSAQGLNGSLSTASITNINSSSCLRFDVLYNLLTYTINRNTSSGSSTTNSNVLAACVNRNISSSTGSSNYSFVANCVNINVSSGVQI